MPQAQESIARRLIEEGFNQGDLAVADEVISPDLIEHQHFGPNRAPGAEGVKAVIASLRRAFSDFHLTIDDVALIGDTVWLRMTGTGTNDGSVHGPPADRSPYAHRRFRRTARRERAPSLSTGGSPIASGPVQAAALPSRPAPAERTTAAGFDHPGSPRLEQPNFAGPDARLPVRIGPGEIRARARSDLQALVGDTPGVEWFVVAAGTLMRR